MFLSPDERYNYYKSVLCIAQRNLINVDPTTRLDYDVFILEREFRMQLFCRKGINLFALKPHGAVPLFTAVLSYDEGGTPTLKINKRNKNSIEFILCDTNVLSLVNDGTCLPGFEDKDYSILIALLGSVTAVANTRYFYLPFVKALSDTTYSEALKVFGA